MGNKWGTAAFGLRQSSFFKETLGLEGDQIYMIYMIYTTISSLSDTFERKLTHVKSQLLIPVQHFFALFMAASYDSF